MGRSRRRRSTRCATWLAFGLVALAGFSCSAQTLTETDISVHGAEPSAQTTPAPVSVKDEAEKSDQPDHSAEATRAYRQALTTLSSLTAHPPTHTRDPYFNPHGSHHHNTNHLLSSFIPNIQGPGPLATAFRIALKLRQQPWVPRSVSAWLGLGPREEGAAGRRKTEELRGKAIKVVDLLQHSAELGHTDALFTLAKLSLLPPTPHFASDPPLAYASFVEHAAVTGNATSQAYVGFFHATGYRDVVPVDQGKAQLYYTFAAHGGDKGAQMTLGYRYWTGIGTLQDCGRAVEWYESAAEQAMARFLSGPPGGRTLPLTATRLSDLIGGVYGPGASVASTGLNAHRPAIKAAVSRAAGETWEDVLEYYLFNADRGELDFALRLGKIFYQGSIYATPGGIASGSEGVGAVPRDYARARAYFLRVARGVWPRDPPPPHSPLQHATLAPAVKDDAPAGVGWAVTAAAYLGRMYLRGEGVKADAAVARMWFERGAEYGERECNNGLGLIWRDGLVDGRKDVSKAIGYFTIAAGQELPEAQVNLAKMFYQRGDLKSAITYFEAALRNGSPFEAFYYLADIQHRQAKNPAVSADMAAGSCATAVSFYKLVAERGVWQEDLLRDAERAWGAGTDRGRENAMLLWWMAAERGAEIAQNNLAYVLDQDKSVLRLTRFAPITPSNDTARLALLQWTRSSGQHNIDALVKVGDYYYHGLGVPDEAAATRWEKAAGYYRSAADTQLSALAMWNLGWMYENGLGVPQDFHLAKRYYDLALETNAEAYLPVMLSLVKLYARSIWHTLTGGTEGLSLWSAGDEDMYLGQQPKQPEIEGARADAAASGAGTAEGDEQYQEESDDDGPWYMGKAREQFNRRRRAQESARMQEEEDPIQWARDRRNAENERDGDFGPEDYFDGALRGGNRETADADADADEFVETVVLVVLCMLVSALLWYRARYMERMRREAQAAGQGPQAPVPAPAGGMFPAEGDPARDAWLVAR